MSKLHTFLPFETNHTNVRRLYHKYLNYVGWLLLRFFILVYKQGQYFGNEYYTKNAKLKSLWRRVYIRMWSCFLLTIIVCHDFTKRSRQNTKCKQRKVWRQFVAFFILLDYDWFVNSILLWSNIHTRSYAVARQIVIEHNT